MKKIIFLFIVIMTISLGSMVFAKTSLTDIKGTKYEDAVNILSTLEIVNGYEDNTYKPKNVVTRAEMAKLLVVTLGQADNVASASKESQRFSDVKSSDWEFGYVNLAAKLGIINGYPDGTFGSKKTVSYAEAVAMLLRALEYEDVIAKETDVWPNNYINYAKKLNLFESTGTINANDGAIRGNVALLIWKALRTGVCDVVGQNSAGLVYGQGEALLNRKWSNYVYLNDITISDVTFDDDYKEATVKVKSGTSTVQLTIGAEDAVSMFGSKYNILYNKKTKSIEYSDATTSYTIKENDITSLTSSKIYIEDGASKGYSLPDESNILLYGIDDLEDAVSARLVLSGSTVKAMVAYGPTEVFLAVVTDNDEIVSKKDAIKVVNYKTTSAKTYALIDDEDIPEENSVILYYLNNSNELKVLAEYSLGDSIAITSATKTKIKLSSGKTYSLSDDIDYIVKYNKTSLKSMTYDEIEDYEDSAVIMEYGNTMYMIVFVDGSESIDSENKVVISKYKTDLSSLLTKAKKVNESLYTQASFATLSKAIDYAETNKNSNNLTTLKKAYNDLNSAYNGLKTASTSEKEIIAKKAELRSLINGGITVNSLKVTTCVTNKTNYTDESYKVFDTCLTNAKNILNKTNATLTEVNNAYTNLTNAIKGLVDKSKDEERKQAISKLDEALTNASKVGAKSNYTEVTYNVFDSMYTAAKNINTTTATVAEINKAATDLSNAIEILLNSKENSYNALVSNLDKANVLLSQTDKYTSDTYSALEKVYNSAIAVKNNSTSSNSDYDTAVKELEKAMNNLKTVDSELASIKSKAGNYKLQAIKDILNNSPESTFSEKELKIEALAEAIEKEDSEIALAKKALNLKISEASAYSETEWNNAPSGTFNGTYADMCTALANAQNVLKTSNASSEELKAAKNELSVFFN